MPNAQLFDRVAIGVDVKGFSARNVRQQRLIQHELDGMLTDAASAAGLNRDEWDRRGDGDGETAVLPADVDLLLVVRRFVDELDRLLADHNEDHAKEAGIRLRVAMNRGSYVPGGSLGHGGEALIGLARLLDAPQARQALKDAAQANLIQIISESLFRSVVLSGLGGIRPNQFRQVVVDIPEKKFRQNAYLYVPCGWPPPPDRTPPPNPGRGRNRSQGFLPITTVSGSWPVIAKVPDRVPPPDPDSGPAQAPSPPVEYDENIKRLLTELGEAMDARDYARADELTTRILMESAGRSREGSLRERDAKSLPDRLLTDIDHAWASGSSGEWGFAAQRKWLAGPDRVSFPTLAGEFGWRKPDGTLPSRHDDFTADAADGQPFFPTLRCPDRPSDRDDAWLGRWRTTAMAIHNRLKSWK